VLKGPPPLVNRIETQEDVALVNANKCLMFFAKEDAEVSYLERLAAQLQGRIVTFKVNGADLWPSRLTQYLFEAELEDQIVLTDMTLPKGYKYSQPLSAASEADVLKWAEFTLANAALMNEVDAFGAELDKLAKLLAAKSTLTELQATHVQVQDEFRELQQTMADGIDSAPARLEALRAKYEALLDTLAPVEKLFGTAEDFECVNKAGETRPVSQLLAGKTHLLL